MDFKNLQLTSTRQLQSREDIEMILDLARRLESFAKGEKQTDILKNKLIATLFYEPSTRTKLSFQTACHRLGAQVIATDGVDNSSLMKGETLEDTTRMIDQYADMIIMRHPEIGTADRACCITNKPFINAGDGAGEHPTQALLDMFTLYKEQGKIDGLRIALVGDLKFGRTIHSLVHLLKFYQVELVLVSPPDLRAPRAIIQEFTDGRVKFSESHDFLSAVKNVDVIYMTRVQRERFKNPDQYEKLKDSFILSKEILDQAKKSVSILHPLPRINEIPEYIDSHAGAAYFRQAANGVPVRMALIILAFDLANKF